MDLNITSIGRKIRVGKLLEDITINHCLKHSNLKMLCECVCICVCILIHTCIFHSQNLHLKPSYGFCECDRGAELDSGIQS